MNAITPENEIPPAQSTAASGAFPTEQTNERTATIGPRTTFSSSRTGPDASVTKRLLKKSIGSSEMNPAIRKPATISFHSISQSPRKLWATSDQARTEVSRSRSDSPSPAAEACWWPASAASACVRASSSNRRVTKSRNPSHISAIRIRPPSSSASVNRHPMKTQITIPSSKTRFVEANWNAIAEAKLAPFANIDFAIAIAAFPRHPRLADPGERESEHERPCHFPRHLEGVQGPVADCRRYAQAAGI